MTAKLNTGMASKLAMGEAIELVVLDSLSQQVVLLLWQACFFFPLSLNDTTIFSNYMA
jgi:hypothetical protein